MRDHPGSDGPRLLRDDPPADGSLRKLCGLLAGHRGPVAIAVAVRLLSVAALVAVPPVLAAGIAAAARGDRDGLLTAALGAAALAGARAVAGRIGDRLLARAGERALGTLRARLAEQVALAPLRTIAAHRSGELVTRMGAEVERLGTVVRDVLPALLATAAHLVFAACLLANYSWELLAVLAVGLVPAGVVVLRGFHRAAGAAFAAEAAALADVCATFAESIGAHETLRCAGASGWWLRRAGTGHDRLLDAVRRTVRALGRLPWMVLVECLATASLLVSGAFLVADGRVELAVLVVFVLSARLLFDAFTDVVALAAELQDARAVVARVADLLEVTGPGHPPTVHTVPAAGDLTVRGVTFAYRRGRPVLSGVDLTVGPGDRVALVGPTGAGKSTLAALLAGLYRPDHGTVRFGGTDLAELAPDVLRRCIVLVPQRPYLLLDASLLDNITLVADPPDADRVRAAVDALGLGRWVAGVGGLGARPDTLSAGERQLVGLIRAALTDATVLVLDEATADVDARTAAHLDAALSRLRAGRTLIAIAHRPVPPDPHTRTVLVADGTVTEPERSRS